MTDGPDSSSPTAPNPDDAAAHAVARAGDPAAGARSAAPAPGPGGTGDVDPAAVHRKLLMGLALVLAVASVYIGVFNWPKPLQMVLAGGATIALVTALRRPAGEPPRRPK